MLFEIKNATPPDWVHVLPKGMFAGRDGRGPWTLSDPEGFIDRTLEYCSGTDVVVDYEHQTERSEANGQPAPAAGWVKEYEVRPDGVWAKIAWTPRGAAMIRNGEYRYISPAFFEDKEGNVIRLDSVALVGQPNLELKALNKAQKPLNSVQKQGVTSMDLLAQLAAILGLAEGATEEAVISAVKALTESAGAEPAANATEGEGEGEASPDDLPAAEAELLQAVETLVEVADETAASNKTKNAAATVKKVFARLQTKGFNSAANNAITQLYKKVTSLQQEMDKEKASKAVNQAITQGKVIPGLKDWAMEYATRDLAGFTNFAKSAPVVVSNSQGQYVKQDNKSLTETEDLVCRQLGLSREQFVKSKADYAARN
jgi:phage I-like protein